MALAEEFSQALERGDVSYLRRFWAEKSPGMPQPESTADAETIMHRARTETSSISQRSRFYSHRWLTERGFPSGLPDELKPSAERMFPVKADSVGLSMNVKNPVFAPAAVVVQDAVNYKILEMYADGDKDPKIVHPEMMRVRTNTWKKLVGRIKISDD